jgi:hypothetical protein
MAAIKKIANEVEFNKNMTSIRRSGTTIRNNVQANLNYAANLFTLHGDTTFLGTLVTGTKAVKSINSNTLIGHIKEAYCLVASEKDGVWKFKKNRAEDVLPNVALQSQMWDEYNAVKADKPDFTVEQLKKYLKTKAEASEGVSSEAMAVAALCLKSIIDGQIEG